MKAAVKKGVLVADSFEQKMAKQIFLYSLPDHTSSDQLKQWAQAVFGVRARLSAT